ncbi:MAG: hypothetical protein PHF08_07555, partial [Candidatus Riflebacteria bacterium]|nr:hypothetical protein [Candidatus Riflebacteria bacterium]
YALTGTKWKDCYLDYWLGEGCVRIEVAAMANVAAAGDLYFKRSFNVRSLWEYIKEIGIRAVFNKVLSRFAERFRNDKYYSVGVGQVAETKGDSLRVGDSVVFVAPVFPRACERLVLPQILVKRADPGIVNKFIKENKLIHFEKAADDLILPELLGWQPESGTALDARKTHDHLFAVEEFWQNKTLSGAKYYKIKDKKPPQTTHKPETTRDVAAETSDPSFNPMPAALFGLGNYAKTQILPNLDKKIKITEIHEIDPMQIGDVSKYDCDLSTSPMFESAQNCAVFFIAGYHHTHAHLAIKAIENGAVAVVEKPAVTAKEQLTALLECDRLFPGKLFTCYHMRYNPLFKQAIRDLNGSQSFGSPNSSHDPNGAYTSKREPVHVTADVFEVPLPEMHWYRWPNSQSHIVSNGCHWIDLFLFANDYSRPVKATLELMRNGDSVSFAELANGACLCLHLTHLGSPRIGVQDHVVMRSGKATATVTNGSEYRFEDDICLRRRASYNRMGAYKEMYEKISAAVVAGLPGDSADMIRHTNELVLQLNEIYKQKYRENDS